MISIQAGNWIRYYYMGSVFISKIQVKENYNGMDSIEAVDLMIIKGDKTKSLSMSWDIIDIVMNMDEEDVDIKLIEVYENESAFESWKTTHKEYFV